jgi:hypothetical protein
MLAPLLAGGRPGQDASRDVHPDEIGADAAVDAKSKGTVAIVTATGG